MPEQRLKQQKLRKPDAASCKAQSTQDAGGATRCKQMGPVDVNGGVHTARKQHQRKNIRICACVASHVLCGLGLSDFSSVTHITKVVTDSFEMDGSD